MYWVVWRAYTGVIHYVFDQMSNLQYKIYLLPQTKTQEGRGPQTDNHLSPSTLYFSGQFLRKYDIQSLVSLQIFGPCRVLKNCVQFAAHKYQTTESKRWDLKKAWVRAKSPRTPASILKFLHRVLQLSLNLPLPPPLFFLLKAFCLKCGKSLTTSARTHFSISIV